MNITIDILKKHDVTEEGISLAKEINLDKINFDFSGKKINHIKLSEKTDRYYDFLKWISEYFCINMKIETSTGNWVIHKYSNTIHDIL